MYRVALVSMPFAAIDYPSLALGLFKSRLGQEKIPCDIYYLNMTFAEMIGYPAYSALITRPPSYFACEQLFAESAFGALAPSDESYWTASGLDASVRQELAAIKSQVEPFLARCMAEVDWGAYDIVGFTSLFEQNLATLALSARVKTAHPHVITVFGGPNFEAVMGQTFHRLLPWIDFVCSGEADDVFPELIKRLAYRHPVHDLPGLVYRRNGVTRVTGPAPMTSRLDELPIPDFSDYFARVRAMSLPPGADPCVLMETSRGCWWGEKNHCTFCGLNSQSMKYRTKSAKRAVNEVAELKGRCGIGFVRVVDNILNHDFFDDFLPELAERRLGVTVFFEVKANLRKHQIATLRRAGVTVVQAGIESLSTHTLKLMAKGSTSLMNIQTLKWCKEYGVLCDWNLIYGFPGETPDDYAGSVRLAQTLTHLWPPTGCGRIRLDRFSPNYDRAEEKGLRNVRPMKWYSFLYPFRQEDLAQVAYYFDFDYAEPIDDGGYLPALQEAVARWKASDDHLTASQQNGAMVIDDTRPVALATRYTLRGAERLVLENCDQITTVHRLRQVVSELLDEELSESRVCEILGWLIDCRLVVQERERFLGLPVLTYAPARPLPKPLAQSSRAMARADAVAASP